MLLYVSLNGYNYTWKLSLSQLFLWSEDESSQTHVLNQQVYPAIYKAHKMFYPWTLVVLTFSVSTFLVCLYQEAPASLKLISLLRLLIIVEHKNKQSAVQHCDGQRSWPVLNKGER